MLIERARFKQRELESKKQMKQLSAKRHLMKEERELEFKLKKGQKKLRIFIPDNQCAWKISPLPGPVKGKSLVFVDWNKRTCNAISIKNESSMRFHSNSKLNQSNSKC